MARRVILRCFLSPGDVLTLTAAIKSLHDYYPTQFETDVRTSCDAIFEHNPYITKLDEQNADVIEMHYSDLISRSNQVPNAFLRGYTDHLGKQLGVPLDLSTNRPHIWLSNEETLWMSQVKEHVTLCDTKYWVIVAGTKQDFTLKQWPVEYYQEVVDRLRGRIQFVQVGENHHDHPRLNNVIDLVGKTDTRQLFRLCWWASGGLGPITFLHHIFAAFEKPYVALLGGREPVSWTQYPLQTTLHTIGALSCCQGGACWRSRVVRLNDGQEQDQSLCEQPVMGMTRPVGRCMALIAPPDVESSILRYYHGGALAF
jgi:ADP-heptose:LPS heptosyltransferase